MSPTLKLARLRYALNVAADWCFPRFRSRWKPYRPVDWQRKGWL
jgi:hypothetical protein